MSYSNNSPTKLSSLYVCVVPLPESCIKATQHGARLDASRAVIM